MERNIVTNHERRDNHINNYLDRQRGLSEGTIMSEGTIEDGYLKGIVHWRGILSGIMSKGTTILVII